MIWYPIVAFYLVIAVFVTLFVSDTAPTNEALSMGLFWPLYLLVWLLRLIILTAKNLWSLLKD